MTYYSLNKKLFTVKLLMQPYVTQNADWCSRIPIDLVVIQSKNKIRTFSRQNMEKWDLCYSSNRSVIALRVKQLMLLPSFEVSVLRIEYSSIRMMLKTHHIYVVLHVCTLYVSTDNASHPGPIPDL